MSSMTPLKGKLLIASPALVDPNFVRAVVLVAEHSPDGTLGLILNRPSDSSVADSVGELRGVVEVGDPVYVGGPVQTDAVMVLAEFEDATLAAALVLEDIGFLPAEADMDEITAVTRRARVFAGHSGWAAGQLDAELEEGAWILTEAFPDDVFVRDADELWAAALERKGGAYAQLARVPEDPSVN
jgi:putative transcriptional regulator